MAEIPLKEAPIVSSNHHRPSHPKLIRVDRSPKAFASGAISLVSLPAGAHFTDIENATPTAVRRYTSVQNSVETHIELNDDLVYCNHCCVPSVVFDMVKLEIRVVDDRPLNEGDPLTFFYPSSEWEMDQPFDCTCGAPGKQCKGRISGAKDMREEDLRQYWLNQHIVELLGKRKCS
ncbi:MAG: hypothetical protein M1812_001564 [Candelaria pacifica]|nr:MAG: hypothetical protein M1812_001564 [Candelaria pacifica]